MVYTTPASSIAASAPRWRYRYLHSALATTTTTTTTTPTTKTTTNNINNKQKKTNKQTTTNNSPTTLPNSQVRWGHGIIWFCPDSQIFVNNWACLSNLVAKASPSFWFWAQNVPIPRSMTMAGASFFWCSHWIPTKLILNFSPQKAQ